MSAKSILIGTISGLVAGVVVGLLTAPQSGAETRQKIADAGENLKKKFRRMRSEAADELDELKEIFEHEAEGLKDDVKERVLKLIASTKSKANHVAEEALN
jgi:gas vesicle protein